MPADGARRRAVDDALIAHGLLLVQGQAEVPSVADLLAGAPVTTRGYSWDYEPAWRVTAELGARPDVAECKLLRGRRTLVHERLWPAVHACALAARPRVDSALLHLVEQRPGVSGDECKAVLAVDSRAFQREKGRLEQWLCVWSAERDDVDHHTHDRAWFPWATGKIATGVTTVPSFGNAATALSEAIGGAHPAKLFPVVKRAQPSPAARFGI
jgi:hypothetical protein